MWGEIVQYSAIFEFQNWTGFPWVGDWSLVYRSITCRNDALHDNDIQSYVQVYFAFALIILLCDHDE